MRKMNSSRAEMAFLALSTNPGVAKYHNTLLCRIDKGKGCI